jgi:hypothetical protein
MSVDHSLIAQIAEALNDARLEAVIVGNTAASLHGAPVMTEDVDIVVRDTESNRHKLARVARTLGGSHPTELSDMMRGKRIYLPEAYLDVIFGRIAGNLGFESLRSRGTAMNIGDGRVYVASLADVIRSKRAAGRAKDKIVLPILEQTLEVQGGTVIERPAPSGGSRRWRRRGR